MKSVHQMHIEDYHRAVLDRHPGHNMYVMHRDWHRDNRDPALPDSLDRNWGTNLVFGSNFLQMHHEMVKATPGEPHLHMMHDSVAQWYSSEGHDLPPLWNPLAEIPEDLSYEPDHSIFPHEIRLALEKSARSSGVRVSTLLKRRTNWPAFEMPKYFTVQGVDNPQDADPLTAAMKLSDYSNANQLGCALVFPHNAWHVAIGGAMSSTWTAIADPIFYLGVHWFVDRIFDAYKLIEAERSIRALDAEMLRERGFATSKEQRVPRDHTAREKEQIEKFRKASELLNIPL